MIFSKKFCGFAVERNRTAMRCMMNSVDIHRCDVS